MGPLCCVFVCVLFESHQARCDFVYMDIPRNVPKCSAHCQQK